MVPGAWGEASREVKDKVIEPNTDRGLTPALRASVAQSVKWGSVGGCGGFNEMPLATQPRPGAQ